MPPITLDLAALWARARITRSAGVDALSLAPEDLSLHLATHMARSHALGANMLSVGDVLMCVTRLGGVLEWDELVHHAQASGVERYVHASLALAQRTLAAPVPHRALTALAGTP